MDLLPPSSWSILCSKVQNIKIFYLIKKNYKKLDIYAWVELIKHQLYLSYVVDFIVNHLESLISKDKIILTELCSTWCVIPPPILKIIKKNTLDFFCITQLCQNYGAFSILEDYVYKLDSYCWSLLCNNPMAGKFLEKYQYIWVILSTPEDWYNICKSFVEGGGDDNFFIIIQKNISRLDSHCFQLLCKHIH